MVLFLLTPVVGFAFACLICVAEYLNCFSDNQFTSMDLSSIAFSGIRSSPKPKVMGKGAGR